MLVIAVSWAGLSCTGEAHKPSQLYFNRYLGLGFVAPPGWSFVSDEAVQEVTALFGQLDLDNVLFCAVDAPSLTGDSAELTVLGLVFDAKNLLDSKDVLQAVANEYARFSGRFSPPAPADLAGAVWWRVDGRIRVLGKPFYLSIWTRQWDGYAVALYCCAAESTKLSHVDKLLQSSLRIEAVPDAVRSSQAARQFRSRVCDMNNS